MPSHSLLVRGVADLLLPAYHRLFLQACLAGGDDARTAWASWEGSRPGLLAAGSLSGQTVKAFAPLLLAAVARDALPLAPENASTIRAWRVLERSRLEHYRAILADVLARLHAAAVRPVVLKGVALAETVYPDPLLRHCHDIDLLVNADALTRAAVALQAPGHSLTPGEGGSLVVRHDSGMPVSLHTTFCRVPYLRIAVAEVAPRIVSWVIDGVEAARLSDEDALLQVLLQGFGKGRGVASMRWAVDAWHLLAHRPAMDWDRVVDLSRRHRRSVAVFVALAVVHGELGGRVPIAVLEALEGDRARRWRTLASLVPLTPGAPRSAREALGIGGFPARAAIAAAMLPPSPAFLRWRFAPGSD